MPSLRRQSLRRKLLLFFVVNTTVALLVAAAAFVILDVLDFRKLMVHDLEVVADGIGINSVAALEFADPAGGQEVLQALGAYANVVSASIFDDQGAPFVSYVRPDLRPMLKPPPLGPEGHRFEANRLKVYHPIHKGGTLLGMVVIESNMEALSQRLRHFGLITSLVLIASLILASLIASALQGRISGPILRLAALESRVTREKNYALRATHEAEDEVGTLIDGFNEMLDEVQRRDLELTARAAELEHKNREILRTQSQLVQSEKMASLGQLVAGVAHEINNPVNFISSGLPSLRRDVDQALSYVSAPQQDAEFTKVRDRISKLLDAIAEGAERTTTIVKDLRSFSRLDEAELKTSDLHEAIDSTLTLLRNKTKDRIEIVKKYGEIPAVECYIGQLNQVFMNVLNNAAQAINGPGTITIATERDGSDRVRIRIRDSGCGISEAVREKIFDPFFTTKDVGEGTGLGLSISHGVVEKHRGAIEVSSEVGRGTEFAITLPIRAVAAKEA